MNYVIIDGNNEAYRAWKSGTEELISNGESTSAIYGFMKNLRSLITNPNIPCDKLIVVWDARGGSKRRKELYPLYKAQRKHDENDNFEDFIRQLHIIKEMVSTLPVTQLELPEYEGDDLVAAVCYFLDSDYKTIVSADKDFGQLVNDHTSLYKRGMFAKDHKLITPANFFQLESKCYLPFNTILDYKVLKGDTSDNINGVGGVGDKTLDAFFKKFGTLTEALDRPDELAQDTRLSKILSGLDIIMRNYELMDLSIGLDNTILEYTGNELLKQPLYDANKLKQLFATYNFDSFLEKFDNFVHPFVTGTTPLRRFV